MRIDINLGRYGPFHDVKLSGRADRPTLSMEVPGRAMLSLTAEDAEKFAKAILGALAEAGIGKIDCVSTEAKMVTAALIGRTLEVVESGLAIAGEGTISVDPSDMYPCSSSNTAHGKVDRVTNRKELASLCEVCKVNKCRISVVSGGRLMRLSYSQMAEKLRSGGDGSPFDLGILRGADMILGNP